MQDYIIPTRDIARAAMLMSISRSRDEEQAFKREFAETGIRAAAVDFGGDFNQHTAKMVEHAVVAARREGLTNGSYREEGAVAGAAREAVQQLIQKAFGMNVGGKIGMARSNENLVVVAFFTAGLMHLDEVVIGMSHRVL